MTQEEADKKKREKKTKDVFVKLEDKIVKFRITVDCEKLIEVHEKILLNCSKITKVVDKHEYGYTFENYNYNEHYRDVKSKLLKTPYYDREYKDDSRLGERYISYTYYDYPDIVQELFTTIWGDFGLDKGFGVSLKKEEMPKPDWNTLKDSIEAIIANETIGTVQQKERLSELAKRLTEETSPNVSYPSHNVEEYFPEILACITIEDIKTISLNEVDTFLSIFDYVEKDKFNKNIISIDEMSPALRDYVQKSLHNLEKSNKKLELN